MTIPFGELSFRYSRASGPGGQKVNRTNSRVELLFDVPNSPSLSERQKEWVARRLRSYADKSGVLHLVCQDTPSQWRNRERLLEHLSTLMASAVKRPAPKRVDTKPSRASKERRLERKRRHSEVKKKRKKVQPKDWS